MLRCSRLARSAAAVQRRGSLAETHVQLLALPGWHALDAQSASVPPGERTTTQPALQEAPGSQSGGDGHERSAAACATLDLLAQAHAHRAVRRRTSLQACIGRQLASRVHSRSCEALLRPRLAPIRAQSGGSAR
jgi:hypothetical protein